MITLAYDSYATQVFSANSLQRKQSSSNTGMTASPASAIRSDTVEISPAARDLARQNAAAEHSGASATLTSSTFGQGTRTQDLESFFRQGMTVGNGSLSQELPPILLPNEDNVAALVDHISELLPDFLTRNNIPEAPANISYDTAGQIQLPDDYAYAAEFKAALDKNPALANELRTVNALSSHLAGMKKSMEFQQEYTDAATAAAARAVVEKYSALFQEDGSSVNVRLNFSPAGELSITVDGKAFA